MVRQLRVKHRREAELTQDLFIHAREQIRAINAEAIGAATHQTD
ncbi:hypothetical protein [Palleronia sp.]